MSSSLSAGSAWKSWHRKYEILPFVKYFFNSAYVNTQCVKMSSCCSLPKAANSDACGKDWLDFKALLIFKLSCSFCYHKKDDKHIWF